MIWLSGAVRPEMLRQEHVGVMLTPNMRNAPDLTGTHWAADTGCFSASGDHGFNRRRYLKWLAYRQAYRATCLFATAPDVVGDADATWRRSESVLPLIRALGYPAALVAQDGIEDGPVPWDEFDVLFIGGTTQWKLSHVVSDLIRRARECGKWVHAGRVNSLRRLRAFQVMGCQSADGTFLRFAPDTNLARLAGWMDAIRLQPSLWAAA